MYARTVYRASFAKVEFLDLVPQVSTALVKQLIHYHAQQESMGRQLFKQTLLCVPPVKLAIFVKVLIRQLHAKQDDMEMQTGEPMLMAVRFVRKAMCALELIL